MSDSMVHARTPIRWNQQRKKEVLDLIRREPHRQVEVQAEHSISDEELAQWQLDDETTSDLRVTRIQQRRRRRAGTEMIG